MEQVLELYRKGKKMPEIASELNMPYNTVKSIIRRDGIQKMEKIEKVEKIDDGKRKCKCCGNPVNEVEGKRDKLFCSARCRLKYWRHHHGK